MSFLRKSKYSSTGVKSGRRRDVDKKEKGNAEYRYPDGTKQMTVLLEPWKEYRSWVNEVWAVPGAWLRKPENQRVAVDVMKATITAFRRANTDLAWYTEKYRKHATIPKAAEATEEELRPLWRGLAQEIKAWPPSDDFHLETFRELLPIYKAAEAVAGTVKIEQVVDTTYTEQALKELGA